MKNATNGTDINTDDGALSADSNSPFGKGIESDSSGEMTVYEVKSGDTISEIAVEFDVSMNTIKWENNLTGSTLKVGQKLNILPVTGVKHIIKKGDNLDKIAAKYEADVTDIMVFNDVSKTEGLKVGGILYVPNGIMKPAVIAEKPSSKKPGSSPSYTPSTVASGYYLRPAGGPTTSPYGSRRGGFHYGIDIGVSRGSTVLAAATGTVVEAVGYCVEGRRSCGGRYGNYIMIQHLNGTFTRYAHLSKVSVSVGDTVSQGDQIAKSGNTGRSTGPHLHFQIEKSNGSTIRPVF
ncbi:MAG: M23 family metallopeptidase [Candidatus Nomurabacteria bacterium]|nr:M23 family metallopeptidase [Candidatus Nomurabacteria bacterium]